MIRPRSALAVLALAVVALAAVPSRAAAPAAIPADDATALVRRYLGDLAAKRYDDAYALLVSSEKRYHGDARGYASVYLADEAAVGPWSLVRVSNAPQGRVYFVREHLAYLDHALGAQRTIDATVALGVLRENGRWAIKDPGHPQRAFRLDTSVDTSELKMTVRKISFWPEKVELVATFANHGSGAVTVLPYAKTVLKDEAGDEYRIIAVRNWALTDRRLFEGLRLGGGHEYTGVLGFSRPAGAATTPKRLDLTIAPALRDGADQPFALTVAVAPPNG